MEQRFADWRTARDQACADTWRAGIQSEQMLGRRMQCPDRRLGELGVLVALYGGAVDGEMVDRAVEAVHRLPAIADCADPERLAGRYASPSSPALDARRAALAPQLDQLHALAAAGRAADAVRVGKAALAEVERLEDPAAEATLRVELSTQQRELGELEDSRDSAARAATLAARAGDDHTVARAGINLINTVGYRMGKTAEALGAAPLVEAALARVGDDDVLRAELDTALGATYLHVGRYGEARAHLTRALERYRVVTRPDDPLLAQALNNLGLLEIDAGEDQSAIRYLEQALAVWSSALGDQHPHVALALNNLGITLSDVGRHDDARRAYERALAIWEQVHGPNHLDVGMVLLNLGVEASRRGELAEAQALYERSLAIRELHLGPEHRDVGMALHNLGAIAHRRGDDARAVELQNRALVAFEASVGADHPFVVVALSARGEAQRGLGALAAAVADGERALAVARVAAPERVADVEFDLAKSLWAAGRRRRAVELARAASAASADGTARDLDEVALAAWLRDHALGAGD